MYIPTDIYKYFVKILPIYYVTSYRQLNYTFKRIFEEFYNFKLTYGDSVELLKKNKLKVEDKNISLYILL